MATLILTNFLEVRVSNRSKEKADIAEAMNIIKVSHCSNIKAHVDSFSAKMAMILK